MKERINSLHEGRNRLLFSLTTIPRLPGIYQMLSQEGEILYIGKAKNLHKRVFSYTHIEKLPVRLKRMVSLIDRVFVITTRTEMEALLLECNLIKKHRPRFNVLLKDDKSFPYICMRLDHTYAMPIKHRGERQVQGVYFGPYSNAEAVRETIVLLSKIFQLRTCSDGVFKSRERPCLQYDIKRCSAPCVNKVSKEEYQEQVDRALLFLRNKTEIVKKELIQKMAEASDTLLFEKAALYRDQIKWLNHIHAHQRIHIAEIEEADVVAFFALGTKMCVQIFFYRYHRQIGEKHFILEYDESFEEECVGSFLSQFYANHTMPSLVLLNKRPLNADLIIRVLSGDQKIRPLWHVPRVGLKRELVEQALSNAELTLKRHCAEHASLDRIFISFKQAFSLPSVPKRIEAYDNSHLMGTNAYGVMVVATKEGFDKKSYRKFAIQSTDQGDDYQMMREVMIRRLQNKEWPYPDLFIIDGGMGQISVVHEVLDGFAIDIPVVGIAKGVERKKGAERFCQRGRDMFTLESTSELFYFLQRFRDEAHNFAITSHRKGRTKALSQSSLDLIEGIGPQRKKRLLASFGSVEHIRGADILDIAEVEGISLEVAKRIYNYFHEK